MYDKNGKLTVVAQTIFNSGMERLRAGEDALDIAKDLLVQVKLVEFNGDEEKAHNSGKQGYYWWLFVFVAAKLKDIPKTIVAPIGTMSGRLSKQVPNYGMLPITYRESPFLTDRIIAIP